MNTCIDDTELFWQQQFKDRFKGLERFRKLFGSWKEFYTSSLGATYLVLSENKIVYHDIGDAYKEFIYTITLGDDTFQAPSLNKVHLLSKYMDVFEESCQLYIIFPDREIDVKSPASRDYLLLSVTVDEVPEFFVSEGLAEMPVLDQGIFSLRERKGVISIMKNHKLSQMIDRPNEVVEDEDFITVSHYFLAKILGDGFEIDEDRDSNVVIKGGITHERFRIHFKHDHRKEDAEDYADEDYLPYTIKYNEDGLEMWMEIYEFICTSPIALEINQILKRARSIPLFLE